MTKLYCPECGNYLENGSGVNSDCPCGWNQPKEAERRQGLHLRLDCIGAFKAGEHRHPQILLRHLGITYGCAIPQSIGDQWWFFDVTLPEGFELPPYFEFMEVSDQVYTHWTGNKI